MNHEPQQTTMRERERERERERWSENRKACCLGATEQRKKNERGRQTTYKSQITLIKAKPQNKKHELHVARANSCNIEIQKLGRIIIKSR